MCGAHLSGIGDWVEHACPNAVNNYPGYLPQVRRRGWPAPASEVHRQRTEIRRTRPTHEALTKTFEQLLTDDDRAWMHDIEKAFQ